MRSGALPPQYEKRSIHFDGILLLRFVRMFEWNKNLRSYSSVVRQGHSLWK